MNCENDEFTMKNPNLYITLAESEHNGYLLQESDSLITTENSDELFY